MKISFISLGCPKNLVDSEEILGLLTKAGFDIIEDTNAAEIIIINTCGFIESAKVESINMILETAKLKKTAKLRYLVATGCLAQRYGKELFDELPEVDGFIGTDCFREIVPFLQRITAGERLLQLDSALPPQDYSKRLLTTPKHYAYLKIAEGCSNCCSFCSIPQIRGPYVSKPMERIIEEAKELLAAGVKEIILIAQDTTQYGYDLYGKFRLPELLQALHALPALKWLRVMYMYPNNFSDELIECFATMPKLLKYIDIPLQHASDRLLEDMNRHSSKNEVEELLAKLRKKVPGIVIRTTFIVGFPGETEADFRQLCEFIKMQQFENAGVFQYSKEEGTVAGARADQVDEKTKEERYDEIMSEQAKISENCHKKLRGKTLEVVVEGFDEDEPNLAFGRSYREAPDIDGAIFIENAGNLKIGDFVKVKIDEGYTYEAVGCVEEDSL